MNYVNINVKFVLNRLWIKNLISFINYVYKLLYLMFKNLIYRVDN